MSWIGLVIALLYLVIHVASIVAKEAAKRKERERRMEQAERRRMGEARLEIPGPDAEPAQLQAAPMQQSRPVPTTAPLIPRGGGRLDDLAAQRKRQLEQLRGAQSSRPPRPPQSVPGRPGPSPPPRQAPFQPQGRMDVDRDRLKREAATRAEHQGRVNRQRAALAKAQKFQQAQHEAATQRRAEFESAVQSSEAPRAHASPISRARATPAILRRLKDRSALRELFILKEVIDPPLSLRADQSN